MQRKLLAICASGLVMALGVITHLCVKVMMLENSLEGYVALAASAMAKLDVERGETTPLVALDVEVFTKLHARTFDLKEGRRVYPASGAADEAFVKAYNEKLANRTKRSPRKGE